MKRKSPWFAVAVVVLLLEVLAACHAPASEASATPIPTAPVTIQTSPDTPTLSLPTPTPTPVQRPKEENHQWGCRPIGPYDRETPPGFDPTFTEELLPNQDHVPEEVQYLYDTCYNLPPALASTVSAFPSITQTCGLHTSDPAEINSLLYTSQDGAELQEKLLNALQELLESKGTDLEIVHVSGEVRLSQAYRDDPPVYEGYETLSLFWSDSVNLRDATQLKITRNFADGSKEIGYFDIDNGYCRCLSTQDFPY